MIVVIFESWPRPGKGEQYLDLGKRMAHLLEGFDGFISIERFESVTERGKFVALSFWRDERSVDAFRNISTHRGVQARSRAEIFDNFRLRVAKVIRDYTKTDRTEAPADSAIHTSQPQPDA